MTYYFRRDSEVGIQWTLSYHMKSREMICQKLAYIYTIFQVTHTVHMLFCTFMFLGLRIEGEKK